MEIDLFTLKYVQAIYLKRKAQTGMNKLIVSIFYGNNCCLHLISKM